MYIAEVVIDGFKSYAQRVTLSNFDKSFNAITGLNGSGKSNVLDSICFVMGIKNLSQVRAGSLHELVYKQGQAGTSKATVSITWHNDDPEHGPAGYKDKERITVTRTVVVGGRNKYQINGVAAQENRVQDFFHSVQLNVNNPHFLIMQGRITKVLNMKPPEILSLLEEAAGTRMYEKKKEGALRTLEKKQTRLDQIDQVLQEDILPSLNALKLKCQDYQKWANAEAQKDHLLQLLVAFDYMNGISETAAASEQLARLQQEVADANQSHTEVKEKIADRQDTIKGLEAEKEIQAGGEVHELQAAVDELSMELTKVNTHYKSRRDALKTEQANLASLQAAMDQLAAQDLPGQVKAAEEAHDIAATALNAAHADVEAAQRELAGAEAGDGRDHTNRSLKERLADAQRDADTAKSEQKAARVKADVLAKQLAECQKALSSCGKQASEAQKARTKEQQAIAEVESKLQDLGYDAEHMAGVDAALAAAATEVRAAREQVEHLSQDVAGCTFQYSNPGHGFDDRRVRGVLARLLGVKDPNNTLALEVAAGGKLWQVVVDDDTTAKQLLQGGRLQRRVTIIPLNKVKHHTLSDRQVRAVGDLGEGRAQPALALVDYQPQVKNAVEYALGTTVVCQDSGVAKKLAFSKEVNSRCVTLEGDDFNPSGLLTGGKRNTNQSVLRSLAALSKAEDRLEAAQMELHRLQAEMKAASGKAQQFKELSKKLQLAQHSLTLLEERLAGTQAAQLAAQCDALTHEVAEAKSAQEAAELREAELKQLCKELEHEMKTFASGQGKRIKDAQGKLKTAKAQLDRCKAALKAAEAAVVKARAELEGAADEQAALNTKISEAQATYAALEEDVAALESQATLAQTAFGQAEQQLNSKRARLRECDKDLAGHHKELTKLQRQLGDLEATERKLDNRIKQHAAGIKQVQEHLQKLEKEYSWVTRDKAQFGTGDFDFKQYEKKGKEDNVPELRKLYNNCLETLQNLKNKADSKVIDKLQKAEQDYNQLQEKRQKVENDRNQLTKVIEQLDEKKKMAMESTWEKVNHDFGAIFTTLLPGTRAKLQPPEGCTFLDGLEVRVAFGSVWKGSLTELSGGQRSLLALSLILALCKFKPAPLYILDEVDSALDLNHTQNVGRMIREHFPQSQFLVVSLKEGMFSNANVIFRTKFVDGVSNITRTVPSQQELAMRGAAAAPHKHSQENMAGPAGKAAAASKPLANRRALLTLNQ